jgi:hypothetical protein
VTARNHHQLLAGQFGAINATRNELVLGGTLAEPVDGAVLLFRPESRSVVEEFARTDPYVVNGLVIRWRVREWLTVAGEMAANPIRPSLL